MQDIPHIVVQSFSFILRKQVMPSTVKNQALLYIDNHMYTLCILYLSI